MSKYDKYKKPKYYAISEYVDIDTGEMLTKREYELNYYKIKTSVKYEHSEKHTIARYTTECRRSAQTKLEF